MGRCDPITRESCTFTIYCILAAPMMPTGCCWLCSASRHGVTAEGRAMFIFLTIITITCLPTIDALNDNGGRPVLYTVWLATYRATSTGSVSNECGQIYARYFLQEFLKAHDQLQKQCLQATIAISSVARVRLLSSKISLDTFLDIKGSERAAAETCLQRLNTTLQDISSIANVTRIPRTNNCSEVVMSKNIVQWTACSWKCEAASYVYNGSSSCQGNHQQTTWNCTRSCREKFTSCLFGLNSQDDKCVALNRGLNCMRNRRRTDPARYGYCWNEIESDVRKIIKNVHSCEVDMHDIDPNENICTSTTTTATTTTTTATPSDITSTPNPTTTTPTHMSTTKPLDWDMQLKQIDNIDQAEDGPYKLELLEGGSTKNVTVLAKINKHSVCENIPKCSIFVDIKISDHAEPKCRSTGKAISQVVVGRPFINGEQVPETETDVFCMLKMAIPQSVGVESEQMITIPLDARVDNKYDGLQVRTMTLSFRRQSGDEEVFSEETNVEIEVTLVNRDNIATCSSIGDPHMTTFDGRPYNNLYQGEFILYRHKSLLFQVNVVFQSCDSASNVASCNCAVAVKSGDDVFVFDRCRRNKPKFMGLGGRNKTDITVYKADLYCNGELTPKTSLHDKGEGKKYILYLPTGSYVKILVTEEHLNVWVVASTNDFNRTEGLCGSYDNNQANDFQLRSHAVITDVDEFSLDWRVTIGGEGSILTGVPPSEEIYEPNVFCRCGMDGMDCDYALDVETCDIYEGENVTQIFYDNCIDYQRPEARRRKRQVINAVAPIAVDTHWEPPNYEWTNEVERTNAESFCEVYIMDSYVGKLCSMIPGVDFGHQVEVCVADIKITEGKSWVESANDAMKESCLEQIKKNGSIPDDLVNQITGAICIRDCSGPQYGTCLNGQCECQPERSGVDCSVKLDEPPDAAELPKYGLCDSSIQQCDRVIVYGENFLNTPELVCLLQAANILENGYSLGNKSKEDASFINFNAVECPIPIIRPYIITVSNDDGKTQSDQLIYIPYDSSCRICDTNIIGCELKAESCYIRDNCYQRHELNSGNSCLVCRPDRNASEWTEVDTCTAPVLSDLVVATISAVFGSLVGLALGVIFYILCCRSRKSDGSGMPMDTRESDHFSPTMQPVNDDMLHRNSHVVPNEFPGNPEHERNNYRGYAHDYGQGVENGVDDTTYF